MSRLENRKSWLISPRDIRCLDDSSKNDASKSGNVARIITLPDISHIWENNNTPIQSTIRMLILVIAIRDMSGRPIEVPYQNMRVNITLIDTKKDTTAKIAARSSSWDIHATSPTENPPRIIPMINLLRFQGASSKYDTPYPHKYIGRSATQKARMAVNIVENKRG